MTVLNSRDFLDQFVTKFKSQPTDMIREIENRMYNLRVDERILKAINGDVNHALILSNASELEQKNFVRFYCVYLKKIYDVRKLFHRNAHIDWKEIGCFINSNISYHQLFLTCIHYFF